MPTRIAPTTACPEPTPPAGGTYIREADGGLRPADQATATAAGLDWTDPTPATQPDPHPEA